MRNLWRGAAARLGSAKDPAFVGARRCARKNNSAARAAGALLVDRLARNYAEVKRGDVVGSTGRAARVGGKLAVAADGPAVTTTSRVAYEQAIEQANAALTSDYTYLASALSKSRLGYSLGVFANLDCKEAPISPALAKARGCGVALATPNERGDAKGDSGAATTLANKKEGQRSAAYARVMAGALAGASEAVFLVLAAGDSAKSRYGISAPLQGRSYSGPSEFVAGAAFTRERCDVAARGRAASTDPS